MFKNLIMDAPERLPALSDNTFFGLGDFTSRLVARSWIKRPAPKPRVLSFAPVCIREVRNSGTRGPDRLWDESAGS